MAEMKIDESLCKTCGSCVLACCRGVFVQDEKGTVPRITTPEMCFGCGQCVAVCPQGAISHNLYPDGTVTPVQREKLPDYDGVLELIRSRRSRRRFRDKPVEREVLEKVLDAARFAPSGHNEQATEYVVVQDPDVLGKIGAITAKGLRRQAMPFQYAVGRAIMRMMIGPRGTEYVTELAPELEGLAEMYDEGRDLILNEAPVLVLFCADSAGGNFANVAANLGLQNAYLAAESLGLGCFYAGFIVLVSERDDSIAKLVGLPDTHKIYGALAMGYPKVTFRSWPERKPLRVTWVGTD